MMDKNFWTEKKVLITGHTGFKGSWLANMLNSLHAEVHGLSNTTNPGIYEMTDSKAIYEKEYFIDIRNFDKSQEKELIKNNYDIIFHFAAQSIVSTALENPIYTLETNILGTFNLLDIFNKIENAKVLSIATTDKVYKYPDKLNTEDYELGGKEFYSASKVSKENVINAFSNSLLLENKFISTIRSGNVIGGGDRSKNRLIPDLVVSVLSEKDIVLRNPNSIRPWQHVLDSLGGYLLAAEYSYKNNKSEVFNLNSEDNNRFTVKEITNLFLEKTNFNTKIQILNEDFFEVDILTIDSTKALNLLNWNSKYNIHQVVELIAEWEIAKNKSEVTKNQVKNYLDI